MTIRGLGLLFFCVLMLGGCASSVAPNRRSLSFGAVQPSPVSPDSATADEARLFLGIVQGLVKQGRHGAALAFLDSYARNGEPRSPRYWLLRGNALLGLGRDAEALDAFSRLRGTPLAAHGWNGKGRVAASERDWNAAARDFRKAVDREPSDAKFLNNLAFASMHIGDVDGSTAWLRQARELDPESELIRNNLIIALTLKGDASGANAILATIRDGPQRDAVQLLVKKAIETGTFNAKAKS